MSAPLQIAVVVGSTRPGRVGARVADWVLGRAADRADTVVELVDLAAVDLPPLDEPLPRSPGATSTRGPGTGPAPWAGSTASSS